MFASSLIARIVLLALAVLLLWALLSDSDAGGPEQRYRVQHGDTLWSIAERMFAGDRARGSGLRERNGLDSTTIVPGQVLVLPA